MSQQADRLLSEAAMLLHRLRVTHRICGETGAELGDLLKRITAYLDNFGSEKENGQRNDSQDR